MLKFDIALPDHIVKACWNAHNRLSEDKQKLNIKIHANFKESNIDDDSINIVFAKQYLDHYPVYTKEDYYLSQIQFRDIAIYGTFYKLYCSIDADDIHGIQSLYTSDSYYLAIKHNNEITTALNHNIEKDQIKSFEDILFLILDHFIKTPADSLKNIIKNMNQGKINALLKYEDEINHNTRKLSEYVEICTEYQTKIINANRTLEAIQNTEELTEEILKIRLTQLSKLPMIKDMSIDSNGITIVTKPIYLDSIHHDGISKKPKGLYNVSKFKLLMGEYRIQYNTNDRLKLYFTNLVKPQYYPHPHITGNSGLCTGNITLITRLISEFDLIKLTNVLTGSYLNTVNTGSVYQKLPAYIFSMMYHNIVTESKPLINVEDQVNALNALYEFLGYETPLWKNSELRNVHGIGNDAYRLLCDKGVFKKGGALNE